jgi:single-stranded DNA-binding protein
MNMARDTNVVIMTGRVLSPIELRYTHSNKPVADFKIISNHRQLPQNHPDRLKFAVSLKVTLWDSDALYWSGQDDNSIDPLDKGDEVLVEGSLHNDDFTPKDSDTRTSGRVRIDHAKVKLLKRSRRDDEYEQ